MMLLNFKDFILYNEGLIYSYPINKVLSVIKVLCDKYFNYEISIKNLKDKDGLSYNVFLIEIKYKLNQKINIYAIDDLINTIQSVGYYISLYRVMDNGTDVFLHDFINKQSMDGYIRDSGTIIQSIRLTCEPKYDNTYSSGTVLRNNINSKENDIPVPDVLYHVAPKRYLDEIFRYGLIPKSKSKKGYHPERIYVSGNIDESLEIYKQLQHSDIKNSKKKFGDNYLYNFKKFTNDDINNNDSDYYKYVILRIDCTELRDYIKLHRDVNYKFGYFFYERIDPKYLSEMKGI